MRRCARGLLVALVAALAVVACGSPDRAATSSFPAAKVDDPGCVAGDLTDDGGEFVGAVAVKDGTVLGVCAGRADVRLQDAWDELTSIVPAGGLDRIGVFAGFDAPDSDVQAFAVTLGDSNDRFALVVNLDAADADPEQLRVTLAHEMAHVFTQTPDQLDPTVDAADCTTFHNGSGCFLPGSLVERWIDRFWDDEQLAQVEARADSDEPGIDEAGADDRCALDPAFPGPYAASSPDEDLAESFAAYVFGLPVDDAVQPRLDFLAAEPALSAYARRAAADGRDRPSVTVEDCGS